MSKELTEYEISQALDSSSFREFDVNKAREAAGLPLERRQARVLMEAAAENPVGMAIFARRVICGESYAKAVEFVSTHVTNRNISVGAARVLVHRMNRAITGE